MPGLAKNDIVGRIVAALSDKSVQVKESRFTGKAGDLPWELLAEFPEGLVRRYSIYCWTVGHGGRSRSQEEYRIQTKLKADRRLQFQRGTTLLLGYYAEETDIAGRNVGNDPPPGMEIIVAWDPVRHLRLGASSSCQVPYSVLQEAYLTGQAARRRTLADTSAETVIAFIPSRIDRYLREAAGGHDLVDISRLGIVPMCD